MTGYREGHGHKLVSEDAAKLFERNWRAEVRSADEGRLASDQDLLVTLLAALRSLIPGEMVIDVPVVSWITLALLRSAYTESGTQTIGDRAIRRTPRLAWDALTEVVGGEEALRDRIEALLSDSTFPAEPLFQLARRYLDGWRPSNH